jgi:aryl-alcohol dehydrogenase-like predicted oxidoreductase
MPYCVKKNISILAYSPMAQGLLTGKFGPDHEFQKGDVRSKNKLFQSDLYQRAQQALARLRPIAEELNVSLGQLALAWVISHPGTYAIAGARDKKQAIQNARAAGTPLSPEVSARIDEIGRLVTDYADESPVMWSF